MELEEVHGLDDVDVLYRRGDAEFGGEPAHIGLLGFAFAVLELLH